MRSVSVSAEPSEDKHFLSSSLLWRGGGGEEEERRKRRRRRAHRSDAVSGCCLTSTPRCQEDTRRLGKRQKHGDTPGRESQTTVCRGDEVAGGAESAAPAAELGSGVRAGAVSRFCSHCVGVAQEKRMPPRPHALLLLPPTRAIVSRHKPSFLRGPTEALLITTETHRPPCCPLRLHENSQ